MGMAPSIASSNKTIIEDLQKRTKYLESLLVKNNNLIRKDVEQKKKNKKKRQIPITDYFNPLKDINIDENCMKHQMPITAFFVPLNKKRKLNANTENKSISEKKSDESEPYRAN